MSFCGLSAPLLVLTVQVVNEVVLRVLRGWGQGAECGAATLELGWSLSTFSLHIEINAAIMWTLKYVKTGSPVALVVEALRSYC